MRKAMRRSLAAGAVLAAAIGAAIVIHRRLPPDPAELPSMTWTSVTEGLSQAVKPTWTIAVVGSGFADDADFRLAYDSFVGRIHGDAFFASYKERLDFEPVPFASGAVTVARSSRCFFARDESFGKQVGRVVEARHLPGLTSVLVLHSDNRTTVANVEACAAGELVVAGRNSDAVLPHEFGHLVGGLFDEDTGNASRAEKVLGPNCVSPGEAVPWPTSAEAPPLEGCWHDRTLLRPADGCRMQVTANGFCEACRNRLAAVFSDVPPAFSLTPPAKHTQFLLQVWKGSKPDFSIVSRKVYSGPPPPQVVRGPYVVGSKPDDATVCLGGSTSFGLSKHLHGTAESKTPSALTTYDDDAIFVVLNCGGEVLRQSLRSLEFVRAPPTRDLWVSPSSFIDNRGTESSLTFTVR